MTTRAVAQEGVELIKGIHFTNHKEVITIKQPNGIVREVTWDYDAVATPVLIEAMIQDLEIKNPKTREATREYCLNLIVKWNEAVGNPESDGLTISELYDRAEAFIKGYETALK